MPRLARALVFALLLVVSTAGTAAAQDYPPSPAASVAGIQGGQGQAGADGGTAFTGAQDIGAGAVLGASLLLLGLSALYVGWRRAGRLAARR